ncbi:MAG: translation initiation factor IF-2 [Phycisphaerae bacterium]
MAKRVFELARELGVTSKAVLQKCRAEGLEIKNHMSALSAGLEATVREWFENPGGGTAVEVAEHVDLEKEREKAQKQRRRKKPKTEEPDEEAPGGEQEQQQQEEVSAEQAASAAVAEPPAETAQPTAEAEQSEEGGELEAKAEAEQPAEPQAREEKPEEPEQPEEGEEATTAAEEPEEEPEEKPADRGKQGKKEQKQDIGPAGPQVVPRPAKLKGPRVVRVERPEAVERPPRPRGGPRRGGSSGGGGAVEAPPAPPKKGKSAPTEEKETKRSKRRSPRRRGRSADSGEKIREWRDQDLAERSERLAAAMGGGLRRHRASVRRGGQESSPGMREGKVELEEPITVKSFSAATGIKSGDIIRRMMSEGLLATVNQVISAEQAQMVAADYDIELEIKGGETAEDRVHERFEQRKSEGRTSRAPVVTMLGHVDHGKTSLLDYIRQTAVASGEAGGITQHMGAYRYDRGDTHVVFLDTPGHEAFTSMRARGANMTDVVVLVVAADDGVMPQTAEAINHARAAGVPIVVALNKIDVPNANEQRALGQLAEHGLQPQEWGGDVEIIRTSAETGEGIDTLVETLSLEAELLELKADPDFQGTGFVIESEMDPGLGVVARLLVRDGTLRQGDVVLAGSSHGRARQMRDDRGKEISEAGPSTPVEISGLDEVPQAGDKFYVLEDIDEARDVAEQRRQRARQKQFQATAGRSLQDLLSQIEAGETTQLPLIIKADVQGSIEALVGQLEKLGTDEVGVNILHRAVGGITTSDVTLAEASGAVIIGFNVVADADARQLAEARGIDIRTYRVIYDVTEDVRKALEEGLAPEVREETVGRAEVRQTFKVSRLGTIAGCRVSDGVAARNAKVRVVRDNVVIADQRDVESLKHYKEDAREVRAGMECGVKVAGFDDIQEGDVLEFYRQVEVSRTL